VSALLIENVRIVFPGEKISRGSLLLEGGKIAAINPPAPPPGATTVDGGKRLLTPGLIDVHTHGVQRILYHYDTPACDLAAAARLLVRYGCTCAFPTVVPRHEPDMAGKFRQMPAALPKGGGALMPGIHVEGPFVALGGAACPTVAGDLGLLDDFLAACQGRMAIMSISPDQQNIVPVIRRLRERGVAVFMTHTKAGVDQTRAAIDAGATHATHFYDVFHAPDETEPGARPVGAVETILADPRATVDFICDGVHVHPMAIRLAVAAKGWRGVTLITDSNIGAGLPPGEYDTPWGYPVRVRAGDAARIADPKHPFCGALAGSALTMNAGMRNLLQWLDLPPAKVWAMGTLNPARLVGLDSKGRIAAGADADLVLWDDDLCPARTWVGGECVYERKDTP
jgi:N-acetylglucosamine-6-phosphate deacetylase